MSAVNKLRLEVRRITNDQERFYVEEGELSTVGELRHMVSAHFELDERRTTLIPSRGGGGWPLSDDGAILAGCGINPEAHAYVVDRDVDFEARRSPSPPPAAAAAQPPPAAARSVAARVYVWPHNNLAAWKGRSASEMGLKLKSFFEEFCRCAIEDGKFDSHKGWASFVFATDVGRTSALRLNKLLKLPDEPDMMAISANLPPEIAVTAAAAFVASASVIADTTRLFREYTNSFFISDDEVDVIAQVLGSFG